MYKLSDFDYKDKNILLRVDLNIPVLDNKILDDTRINKIIPTIKYLLKAGAKIVIASHFGRPKDIPDPRFSIEFLKEELSKRLELDVDFYKDYNESKASYLMNTQILLLENLRFNPGETKNDLEFAKQLAKDIDFYVNDAFSCSHRSHASIDRITELLPSAAGLLLTEEVEKLSYYLLKPKSPMISIIGGSKISTKIGLINSLLKQANYVIIGGAMANGFLKAQGYEIGNSFYEEEALGMAQELLKSQKIILPKDVVIADNIEDKNTRIVDVNAVPSNKMILDIGPKTIANINELLTRCNIVVMNGPMGVFEYLQFSNGTFSIAKQIAELTSKGEISSIAGGGDTIAALTQAKVISNFSYVSTAGGAFLEWLENKSLPGIEKLYLSCK